MACDEGKKGDDDDLGGEFGWNDDDGDEGAGAKGDGVFE